MEEKNTDETRGDGANPQFFLLQPMLERREPPAGELETSQPEGEVDQQQEGDNSRELEEKRRSNPELGITCGENECHELEGRQNHEVKKIGGKRLAFPPTDRHAFLQDRVDASHQRSSSLPKGIDARKSL